MDLYGVDSIHFWSYLDQLLENQPIMIDRPKGSAHHKYPEFIYPLDYGHLQGTSAMDGMCLDVWMGSSGRKSLEAVICTVDIHKRDAEVKLLVGCDSAEQDLLYELSNKCGMAGILIKRKK